MADHLIIQIRDALATALAGVPGAGAHVFASRPPEYAAQESELPALWLELGGETVSDGTLYGAEAEVVAHTLAIGILVKQVGDWEKALANIARDVRAAVFGVRFAAGALLIAYRGTQGPPTGDGSGDQPRARWTLVFDVQYATAANVVDVAV